MTGAEKVSLSLKWDPIEQGVTNVLILILSVCEWGELINVYDVNDIISLVT